MVLSLVRIHDVVGSSCVVQECGSGNELLRLVQAIYLSGLGVGAVSLRLDLCSHTCWHLVLDFHLGRPFVVQTLAVVGFSVVVYIFGSLEGLDLIHEVKFFEFVVCSLVEVVL